MEKWIEREMANGNRKDADAFAEVTSNNIDWYHSKAIDDQCNAITEMYMARYNFLCEHSKSKEDLEIAKAAIGTSVNLIIPTFPSEYMMREV